MWEGYNLDESNDLKRSKLSIKTLMDNEELDESMNLKEELESEEKTGISGYDTQTLDEGTFIDSVDEEIDMIEGEVEELEDNRIPEKIETQNPLQAETEEMMELMQEISDDDNEIVR